MAELDSVRRLGWSPYLGKTSTLVPLVFLGRRYVRVQDFWVPAAEAMEQALIATGYENPCDYTGSYNKRYIAGTSIWSWHSYGGAIDLDYGYAEADRLVDKNPHLHRPITDADFGVTIQLLKHQVEAIEAIRTMNGKKVWRWLGWSIGDSMHFEPNCSPDDIKTGIDPTTVAGYEPPVTPPTEDDDMKYWLAIFNLWSREDLVKMAEAGYWDGVDNVDWYFDPRCSDEEKTNLVVHILAKGNKDIPSHGGEPGPQGPAGPAGPQGPKGDTGEVEIFVDGNKVS